MLDLSLLPAAASSSSPSSFLASSITRMNHTLAHSRRPAILTYASPLTSTAKTLTSLPLYILSLSSESEILSIPMFEGVEFVKGTENLPQAAAVSIEADEDMQFYETRLRIVAKLRGLRWVLYNHRIISFFVFTTAFWGSSIMSMGFVWLFLSVYMSAEVESKKKKLVKKEDSDTNGSMIKSEPTPESEGFDPTSLEDLSDTSRTFPTFGRQKPLRYTASRADQLPSIKVEEEPEDTPIQPLAAVGAEADDEEDLEDAGGTSSAWRDSGIGTSLEDERRAAVQRRRKGSTGSRIGR